MSKLSTFQKVKDFLQKLCCPFNSRKKQNLNQNKNRIGILITTKFYNYNNDKLTIQEQMYAEQFKFHDDTYFDEENMR